MSFPTTSMTNGNGNFVAHAPALESSSATPYTDLVYGQIAHGAAQPYFLAEEAGTQGQLSVYPELEDDDEAEIADLEITPLVEDDDGDADTVVGAPAVVGTVEEAEDEDEEDDDDDDDEPPRYLPVDYTQLRAQVADPLRMEHVRLWRDDLARGLPPSYVTDWLRERGPHALVNTSSAKFEAVMGFPREFLALGTRRGPDGTLCTVRDMRKFYQMVRGLWDVKVRTAAVILARRDTYAPGGTEKVKRRRELFLTGEAYWIDPTPLRTVCRLGDQDGSLSSSSSSEIDEDELMEMYWAAGDDETSMGEEDEHESLPVERTDEDVTSVEASMSDKEHVVSDHDVLIDPMLFLDPELLVQQQSDANGELEVLSVSGQPCSHPDVMTDDEQGDSGTPDEEEPTADEGFSMIDPLILDPVAAASLVVPSSLEEEEDEEVVDEAPCYAEVAGYVAPSTPPRVVVDDDVAPFTCEAVADYVAPRSEVQVDRDVGPLFAVASSVDPSLEVVVDEDVAPGVQDFGGVFDFNEDDFVFDENFVFDERVVPVTVPRRVVEEVVEEGIPEPAAVPVRDVIAPVEVVVTAGELERALADLDKITYAEHIAIADPMTLSIDEQILQIEMETAHMRREDEDVRAGRYRRWRELERAGLVVLPTPVGGKYFVAGEDRGGRSSRKRRADEDEDEDEDVEDSPPRPSKRQRVDFAPDPAARGENERPPTSTRKRQLEDEDEEEDVPSAKRSRRAETGRQLEQIAHIIKVNAEQVWSFALSGVAMKPHSSMPGPSCLTQEIRT
ncbi:hypothetical protein V8F33_007425 [Rhypophila sp. PSN 637]